MAEKYDLPCGDIGLFLPFYENWDAYSWALNPYGRLPRGDAWTTVRKSRIIMLLLAREYKEVQYVLFLACKRYYLRCMFSVSGKLPTRIKKIRR